MRSGAHPGGQPQPPFPSVVPLKCLPRMCALFVCDHRITRLRREIHPSISFQCPLHALFRGFSNRIAAFFGLSVFVCCVKCTVFHRSFCALPVGGSGGSKCLFFPGSKCLDLVHIIYIAEKQLFDVPVIPFLHPFGRWDAKNGRIYLFGKKIIFTFVLVLCTNTVYIFSVFY